MITYHKITQLLIKLNWKLLSRKSLSLLTRTIMGNLLLSVVGVASAFTVGGQLTGINGQVGIALNSTVNLSLSTNGAFTFDQNLNAGDSYLVAIVSKPTHQSCRLTNESGVISADVTNVGLQCSELPLLQESA